MEPLFFLLKEENLNRQISLQTFATQELRKKKILPGCSNSLLLFGRDSKRFNWQFVEQSSSFKPHYNAAL